jgi:hypothetical protein
MRLNNVLSVSFNFERICETWYMSDSVTFDVACGHVRIACGRSGIRRVNEAGKIASRKIVHVKCDATQLSLIVVAAWERRTTMNVVVLFFVPFVVVIRIPEKNQFRPPLFESHVCTDYAHFHGDPYRACKAADTEANACAL